MGLGWCPYPQSDILEGVPVWKVTALSSWQFEAMSTLFCRHNGEASPELLLRAELDAHNSHPPCRHSRTQMQKCSPRWFCLDPGGPGMKPQISLRKPGASSWKGGIFALFMQLLGKLTMTFTVRQDRSPFPRHFSHSPQKAVCILPVATARFPPSQVHHRGQFSLYLKDNMHYINAPQPLLQSLATKPFWIWKSFLLHEVKDNCNF